LDSLLFTQSSSIASIRDDVGSSIVYPCACTLQDTYPQSRKAKLLDWFTYLWLIIYGNMKTYR
jgi:hypothetical protein